MPLLVILFVFNLLFLIGYLKGQAIISEGLYYKCTSVHRNTCAQTIMSKLQPIHKNCEEQYREYSTFSAFYFNRKSCNSPFQENKNLIEVTQY